MKSFISLGKRIYNTKNPREMRRMAVFIARCWLHYKEMCHIESFYQQNALFRKLEFVYPFVYEQPTRAFFYYRSTLQERIRLMEQHMTFLAEHLREEVVIGIYQGERYPLWEMDAGGEKLSCVLHYHPGQRKEGVLSLMLVLGERTLYQMMFWIMKNQDEAWSLYIGAMQGPNMNHAKEIIKQITKKCHSYRTKNLIFFMTQAFARGLGIGHIYAVTNEGYYANNHVRRDRKLKTSFSDFWREVGGWETKDPRFDELPIVEKRKSMDEISTHKRAVYRRRFALLDEIDATLLGNLELLKCKTQKLED